MLVVAWTNDFWKLYNDYTREVEALFPCCCCVNCCVQQLTDDLRDRCFPVQPLEHLTPLRAAWVLIGRHWWLTVNLWFRRASLVLRKALCCTHPQPSDNLTDCVFHAQCHHQNSWNCQQFPCVLSYPTVLLLVSTFSHSIAYLRQSRQVGEALALVAVVFLEPDGGGKVLFPVASLPFYAKQSLFCPPSRWGVGLVSDETPCTLLTIHLSFAAFSFPAFGVVFSPLVRVFRHSLLIQETFSHLALFFFSQSSLYLLSWLPRKVCAVCLS